MIAGCVAHSAGRVLQLAAIAAFASASPPQSSCASELSCSAPPTAAQGSALLQHRSAGLQRAAVAMDSSSECSDTPNWQNWLGYDCEAYATEFCRDGSALPGFESFFGEWLDYPEDHCCVCGKGQPKDCLTYPCPFGWIPKEEEGSSCAVGPDCCCEKTCEAYVGDPGCAAGNEPDWDRSSSTAISESECCRATTTTTTAPPFEGPGKARYVRLLPQAWGDRIGARAAVLVGEGLLEVDPPELSRTYSSVLPLNNEYLQEGSDGWPGSKYGQSMRDQCCGWRWVAKVSQAGEWLQIDLGMNMDVRGVVIEGGRQYGCPFAPKNDFIKLLTVETATNEDPTTFEARENGKVFNTIASVSRGVVRLVFGEPAPSPPPTQFPLVAIKSGVECKSDDELIGWATSAEDCAAKVEERSSAARFFIYGTGSKLGKCYLELTSSASCSEGWEADQYDFYSIDGSASPAPGDSPRVVLTKTGKECGSSDQDMGWSATLQECANKVHKEGGSFFIYGYGCKAGRCFMEHTSDVSCSDGWQSDMYDFYTFDANSLAPPMPTAPMPAAPTPEAETSGAILVKDGHECLSGDENMGWSATLLECAGKVRESGGRFFIYGTDSKFGNCYIEHTQSPSCSEGWESDHYRFYSLEQDDAGDSDDDGSTEPHTPTPVLIKEGHTCMSKHDKLGEFATVQECASKVHEAGGSFFSYGKHRRKPGRCLMELTSSASCPEGWKARPFDFYALEAVISQPNSPPALTPSKVEEICPALLYTNKIICNDGSAVEEGECCPDNDFCPSDCMGSSSKAIDGNGQATCSCKGCRKQRKVEMSDADAMLKAHNYLRCLHGHPKLQWDEAVASNAVKPASQSCAVGKLHHSDSYAMTPRAGENLAIGYASPEWAAAAWYNELMDPGYVSGLWGTDAIEAGVGHYTALIWKGTEKLGCTSCVSDAGGGRIVWACQYAEEAPNSGQQPEWMENVPQGETLEEAPETCCAQIYSAA